MAARRSERASGRLSSPCLKPCADAGLARPTGARVRPCLLAVGLAVVGGRRRGDTKFAAKAAAS